MSCLEGHMHSAEMKNYTTPPDFSCTNISVIKISSELSQDHLVNHLWPAETKLRSNSGETL